MCWYFYTDGRNTKAQKLEDFKARGYKDFKTGGGPHVGFCMGVFDPLLIVSIEKNSMEVRYNDEKGVPRQVIYALGEPTSKK